MVALTTDQESTDMSSVYMLIVWESPMKTNCLFRRQTKLYINLFLCQLQFVGSFDG